MEDKQPEEQANIPDIGIFTDLRMRMRRVNERGLTPEASMGELRERILNAVLIAGSAIGIFAYLPNLTSMLQQRQWFLSQIFSEVVHATSGKSQLIAEEVYRSVSPGLKQRQPARQ